MKRFKILAQAVTGPVPETNTIEILFHLQDMQKTAVNQPNAILILSQFCCTHEYLFNDIVDVFVNKLNQDITPANTLVLQACMMGLKNIARMNIFNY